ncbi:DNA-binding MarR family transcriptional regulator [Motilibacter rhizosphaerae]|uniref:DNA-binding MarR family transcriptional regulator n=1 Tax=Motilibacter rhizosphaerae TaxID=598652 RepID=A0A4Q7NUW1_9ACTN|nr:MarR family winged helix-turn-helix transcriptional regulator [Motilibacter rhizosphaerae]RZS91001.1 DNA-binding MarR family transcriptional regulator [Motilibacter rhizosphaerae]
MPPLKNLLVDVWLLSSVATALVGRELAGSTLSVDEFAVYGLVQDLGPVTATQLGQWTGLSATTVSALLRRCEARGELVRTPSPADRRSMLVELTPRGREAYDAALPALGAALGRVQDQLGDGDAEARWALQQVDAAVRAALGVPVRPYRVPEPGPEEAVGELTPAQAEELRAYAAWMRWRDR